MTERRGFLKSLMAGSIAGIPVIKSVEIMDLKPTDIVILSVDGYISDEEAQRLKDIFKRELPDQKCLVLGKGLSVKVLRD